MADIDQNLENSVSRLFADDTKVSVKIKTQEVTERLKQELNKIYIWADENLLEFNKTNLNKYATVIHIMLVKEFAKRK